MPQPSYEENTVDMYVFFVSRTVKECLNYAIKMTVITSFENPSLYLSK